MYWMFDKIFAYRGIWVSQSVGRLTSAQVMISRPGVQALCQALCWQLGAWSLLWIPCLPLSPPLPRSHSVCDSLSKINKHLSTLLFFFLFFFLFLGQRETEHERGRDRERGRHRIGSRLQAPSHQPRAWRAAGTHGPRDRDLAEVGRFNRLRHPGAPVWQFLKRLNRELLCMNWIF